MWDTTILGFTLYQLFSYFFLYAFVGWCLEVVYCSINTGQFVNRGFLNGTLCPIYGFGAVIVIVLLTPIANNILLLFLACVLLTSLLELVTGFAMKALFHTCWWDYSDERLNLGGYICLKFSLLWGVACLLLIKVIHPVLAGIVGMIPPIIGVVILIIMFLLLFSDLILTVSAILHLNRDLGEISRLGRAMHSGSEDLAKSLGNRAISIADKVDALELDEKGKEFSEQVELKREQITYSFHETRDKVSTALEQGRDKISSSIVDPSIKFTRSTLLEKKSIVRDRLLRAFPNMKNNLHASALEEMKQARGVHKTQSSNSNAFFTKKGH